MISIVRFVEGTEFGFDDKITLVGTDYYLFVWISEGDVLLIMIYGNSVNWIFYFLWEKLDWLESRKNFCIIGYFGHSTKETLLNTFLLKVFLLFNDNVYINWKPFSFG